MASVFDLLHENAAAGNALLISNGARGDVFSRPRDVEFAFKAAAREKADALREFIDGKNYGKASVKGTEKADLFWVFVVVHTPITQNVICSLSGFMVCLGRLFDVEYDGWGSVVQSTGEVVG